MILHLHTDSRFTDYTIRLFNSKLNVHLIGKRFTGQRLSYVREKKNINQFVFGWSNTRKWVQRIRPKVVVIHFLDLRWYELIKSLDGSVKVVWIFWGGDGYSLPKLSANLYGKLTSEIMETIPDSGISKLKAELGVKSSFNFSFIVSLFFEALRSVRLKISSEELRLNLFGRIDYCGTFLKEDYELLKRQYSFEMRWIDARFISLEQLIGTPDKVNISGNNILLGNSCTAENNHLDALELLASIDLPEDSKIICPLNYGKHLGRYRETVLARGSESFGSKFHPLIEQLPLKEYTELLKTCAYAIMFHGRQQAFNNILAMIYLGVKVFLTPENTIYHYLKRIGCIVFQVDDLQEPNAFDQLTAKQIEKNRLVLLNEFSQKRIEESAAGIQFLLEK